MKPLHTIIEENKFNDIRINCGKVIHTDNGWKFVATSGQEYINKPVERIRETDIGKKLKKINSTEMYIKTLEKFIKSVKGQKMVNNFTKRPILTLLKDFEAPKPTIHMSANKVLNIFKSAMKTTNVKPTFVDKHIVDYTHLLYDKQLKGELKPSKPLSPREMKEFTMKLGWSVKRDKNGNPVIKTEMSTDSNGDTVETKLYDKISGLPIYCYTPKPKTLGEALRMHMLEEHKMSKWDKKNPAPTDADLKSDLFPNYLKQAYEDKRDEYLEYVREFLSRVYCKKDKKTPSKERLRVFSVHINKFLQKNYPEMFKHHMFYEKDINECGGIGGYPFVGIKNTISNSRIKKELESFIRSDRVKSEIEAENVVAFNVYDKSGNFRIGLKVA